MGLTANLDGMAQSYQLIHLLQNAQCSFSLFVVLGIINIYSDFQEFNSHK
jgi:hypothetical protein